MARPRRLWTLLLSRLRGTPLEPVAAHLIDMEADRLERSVKGMPIGRAFAPGNLGPRLKAAREWRRSNRR